MTGDYWGGVGGGIDWERERERNEGLLDCAHMRTCVVYTRVCVHAGRGGS